MTKLWQGQGCWCSRFPCCVFHIGNFDICHDKYKNQNMKIRVSWLMLKVTRIKTKTLLHSRLKVLIWFIFCGAISDAEMSSFISVLYYLWTNFVICYLFYIIYRVISYQWVWFKINIGRRNLVSKYYFWASTWRSFSNTILKGRGLMLYKVGCNFQGHSKSTSKCFSRNPVHAHLLFHNKL